MYMVWLNVRLLLGLSSDRVQQHFFLKLQCPPGGIFLSPSKLILLEAANFTTFELEIAWQNLCQKQFC